MKTIKKIMFGFCIVPNLVMAVQHNYQALIESKKVELFAAEQASSQLNAELSRLGSISVEGSNLIQQLSIQKLSHNFDIQNTKNLILNNLSLIKTQNLGQEILHIAAIDRQSSELVEFVFDNGIQIDQESKTLLLENFLNHLSKWGIWFSSKDSVLKIISLLLQLGADVNLGKKPWSNPLGILINSYKVLSAEAICAAIKIMFDNGADINLQIWDKSTKSYYSPVAWAQYLENKQAWEDLDLELKLKKIADFLVELGAK